MFSVKIDGLKECQGVLRGLQKQINFAASRALNTVAREVQTAILARTREEFTIRKNWLQPGMMHGINMKSSTKADLSAEVYSRAPWMVRHEEGGIKLPRNEYLAIPQEGVRRTKRDLIPASEKPRGLKRSFVLPTKSGPMLFKRVGRGKTSTIKPMYAFEKSAKIQPRWRFVETARAVVERTWRRVFESELASAIRTARWK